jgi:hypothetical protein
VTAAEESADHTVGGSSCFTSLSEYHGSAMAQGMPLEVRRKEEASSSSSSSL